MWKGTSVPPVSSPPPKEGEHHLLTLQTVSLEAEEEELEEVCQVTTALQKGLAMAALAIGAVVPQPGQGVQRSLPAGMAASVGEGACAFYDLGLMQINILQEKGQAKSSESKPTETTRHATDWGTISGCDEDGDTLAVSLYCHADSCDILIFLGIQICWT